MTHFFYAVIGATLGGIISAVITYFAVSFYYSKKLEQAQIRYFISTMKKKTKLGQLDDVKKAVAIFAKKSLDFQVASFQEFRKKEFLNIADVISKFQNQRLLLFREDGINNMPLPYEEYKENISEEKTQKQIYENLCKIIGV